LVAAPNASLAYCRKSTTSAMTHSRSGDALVASSCRQHCVPPNTCAVSKSSLRYQFGSAVSEL
jgi:hypothetical protein